MGRLTVLTSVFILSGVEGLYSDFCFFLSIIRLLSSAFTSKLLFHLPIRGV